jgi:glycerol-3-phosphate dehydrogenase
MNNRDKTIQSIKNHPNTTVLVIGAGINGIGTFRDLALQGINCLIVERGDFCSGASMASSHMLHGGIRYLENGEFRLVREALHERNNLLRNAPHLTKPLPTTIPIFKWLSGILNSPLKFLGLLDKPAERGAIIIKLGLLMYDAYVRGDSPMPTHRFNNHQKALQKWPEINPQIIYTATYYDGAMNSPERLALEILLDGVNEGDHASAVNYLSAVGVNGNNVILKDEISGEEFTIQPEIVINAGGPWIDFVNRDLSQRTTYIGGTKGSHLIVDYPELRQAIGDHEIFFEYVDGRIVLIFPYLDKHVMIGSTDLRIEDPDQAVCTSEEIDYILGMVPQIFPGLRMSKDQIIFQFTGVRPLPRAKGSTGQISRDHSIEMLEISDQNPWPILSLVGGKWTSYRAFSEQVTDRVLDLLGKARKVSTRQLPIGGGKDYPADDKSLSKWHKQSMNDFSLSEERVRTLFSRYGTRATEIMNVEAKQEKKGADQISGYSPEEIIYLVNKEMIVHLDDFFLRRTKLAWTGVVTLETINQVASILAEELHWDQPKQDQEVDRLLHILRNQHAVKI